MMRISWVVGGGGLLGSSLRSLLASRGDITFSAREPFCWHDSPRLVSQMTAAVRQFADAAKSCDKWEIYWAAGVGTMGASREALTLESQVLANLLELIGGEINLIGSGRQGAIAYASSAGAIYAACRDLIITEKSEVAPTTPYAQAKLEQEKMLLDFAASIPGISLLIARISTLYGPGQSQGKGQGLLTHIARSIVRNQPVQIYVPFDTIRDYIASSDAALSILQVLREMVRQKRRSLIKIVASEQAVTISEIIAIYRRLSRRHLRVVTSASRLSSLYSRRICFRSVVFRPLSMNSGKRLTVGLAEILAHERYRFSESKNVEISAGGGIK